MDKSTDRMCAIYKNYIDFDVNRIEGVDGVELWGDGTVDNLSRYNWNGSCLDKLIADGIIETWYRDFGDARPPDIACNLSQRRALLDFYNSNDDVGIIIEDDTLPLDGLNDFKMPTDVDFYCLLGVDHPGNRVATYSNGEIKFLRNLSGYAITKKGAELAMAAIVPFWNIVDIQLSFSIFRSVDVGTVLPVFKIRKDLIKAVAPSRSLVGLSHIATNTTCTKNGKKEWMPCGWDSVSYQLVI